MHRLAGKATLRVGEQPAASVELYSGGEPWAEVIDEPGGLLPYAKKHVGELRFADLEAQIALDAHPAFYRWIRDAWFGDPGRDRVVLDPLEAGSGSRTLELAKAHVHEVVLPGLDTSSREKRSLLVRITPRAVRRVRSGHTGSMAMERPARDFYAQNFVVNIDGLDCSGVLSVDPITVRTKLPEETGGRQSQIVFPDLHLHLDADKAEPFHEWFEDFIIRGNNDDDQEKGGTITYMDPLLSDPLGVLILHHLGIYRIADEAPNAQGIRRVRVDLYCERMELSPTGVAAGNTEQGLPPVMVPDDEEAS
jgi:hypothetical protein